MLISLGKVPWSRGYGSMGRTIHRRTLSVNSAFFKVSEDVQDALRKKKPVVALETTIYTHGGFFNGPMA